MMDETTRQGFKRARTNIDALQVRARESAARAKEVIQGFLDKYGTLQQPKGDQIDSARMGMDRAMSDLIVAQRCLVALGNADAALQVAWNIADGGDHDEQEVPHV